MKRISDKLRDPPRVVFGGVDARDRWGATWGCGCGARPEEEFGRPGNPSTRNLT